MNLRKSRNKRPCTLPETTTVCSRINNHRLTALNEQLRHVCECSINYLTLLFRVCGMRRQKLPYLVKLKNLRRNAEIFEHFTQSPRNRRLPASWKPSQPDCEHIHHSNRSNFLADNPSLFNFRCVVKCDSECFENRFRNVMLVLATRMNVHREFRFRCE